MKRIIFSSLLFEVLNDGRTYRLTAPFVVSYADRKFLVPRGFETDLASVPRILWSIFPPHGQYSKAAVLHDYLYRVSKLSRAHCDRIFLDCMEALGVPLVQRRAMYLGVRMFGGLCR